MTPKQIGSRIAVKAALLGIAIAYFIMAALIGLDEGISALLWVFDFNYWLNLFLGAVGSWVQLDF